MELKSVLLTVCCLCKIATVVFTCMDAPSSVNVLIFGNCINVNPSYVGAINPDCHVPQVFQQAYNSAKELCQAHYPDHPVPKCEVQCMDVRKSPVVNDDPTSVSIVYVPSHIFHMFFELIKNAMRATVEYHAANTARQMPPIKVLICGGEEDVTIELSDRGGGISRSMMDQVFNYTFSTARRVDLDADGNPYAGSFLVPFAGYGYGLPLSRLYARYFQGDLQLRSIEGLGTDALIYLKRRSREADELLPVFNQTSARQYERQAGNPGDDWCRSSESHLSKTVG